VCILVLVSVICMSLDKHIRNRVPVVCSWGGDTSCSRESTKCPIDSSKSNPRHFQKMTEAELRWGNQPIPLYLFLHPHMSRTSITATKLFTKNTLRLQSRTMVNVPLFGMKERQPTADEKALIDDVVQLCMSPTILDYGS
jgi:hypothetical protein